MTTTAEVVERALAAGFDRAGVARAERLETEEARLGAWLDAGKHGQMQWMAEHVGVRVDPTHEGMLAGARSVIVCALAFARPGDPSPRAGVARYARGHDYHNVVRKKARRLAAWLRRRGHRARPLVDDAPILERAWAQRAGIGFVGKSCMLIVPGLGSHVFLAEVVTDAELEPSVPAEERCGACTLCLDACPTAAFDAGWQLDARRCVSYLTIEHRGPIDPALRSAMGPHLFGCDACQDVCPYNRTAEADPDRSRAFAADERWDVPATALLRIDEAAFLRLAHGSPVRRATRDGLVRNACLVLGNTAGPEALEPLRRVARDDGSTTVREAASWAMARIEERATRR